MDNITQVLFAAIRQHEIRPEGMIRETILINWVYRRLNPRQQDMWDIFLDDVVGKGWFRYGERFHEKGLILTEEGYRIIYEV